MSTPQYAVVIDLADDYNPISDSNHNVCLFPLPVDLEKVAQVINTNYEKYCGQIKLIAEEADPNKLRVIRLRDSYEHKYVSYVIEPCTIIL